MRNYHQWAVIASLVLATCICVVLLVLRFVRSQSFGYWHLLWNLFLALLPALSAFAAYDLYKKRSILSWMVIAACSLIWVSFFPNAPYLVTDLMHLQQPRGEVPY